jgi:O-antigen/teichoic acid export membrane protein
LVYPIIALGSTHQKIIEKKLAFKRTFLPELLRSLTKGGATIGFALSGFGVWSLILGQLCSEVVSTIAYWISAGWVPSMLIDRDKAYSLLSYGAKYVGADAVAVLLLNLDYLLVGRYLGAVAMGVYTLAFRLPDLIVLQFARTLSGVVFPIYSRMRETSNNMARGFLLTTRYISLITVPMGVGLALVAKPFTEVMFSSKWVDAVPAIQGLAIYSMLLSLAYNAGGAYKASGRPQIIIWLGVVRLGILLPALWWAVNVPGTIVAVSWMHAAVAFVSAAISLYLAARILNLQMSEIYAALYPSVVAGLCMAAAVYGTLWLTVTMSALAQLLSGTLAGGVVYLMTLWLFQRDVVLEASQKLRTAFGQR